MNAQTESPSLLKKLNFSLADASPEYIQRRKRQAMLFMAAAAASIFTSRFAYKSTVSRQYVPLLFHGNHLPPITYNFTSDAAAAVGTGTMLSVSVSSMMIFGACWVMDVSSFKEFGWRMKSLMGGDKKEREISQMPLDEDTEYFENVMESILSGEEQEES